MQQRFFKILILILTIGSIVHAEPLKIMPFGDSITFGDHHFDTRPAGKRHAYRNFLYYKLQDQNVSFHFVGSVIAGQDVTPAFEPYNEGYPGQDSVYMADHVYNLLTMNPPDIMLIHLGTNDHNSGKMSGMIKLLNEIDRYEQDSHHPIRVVLALIIQRQHGGDLTIEDFNNNLAVLAHDLIYRGDDIILVDMEHDAGLTANDYIDGTHPNNVGYNKMANVWVNPILEKRTDSLYLFPITLVDRKYISKATISEQTQSVTFDTTVPNNGIQF